MYSFLWSCRVAGPIVSSRPWFGWECLGVLAVACVLAGEPVLGSSPARGMLAMVDRTVTQDQGAWVVDYRLRHTGRTGVIVTPEEIGVKVEGWVSNSRVASHAVPRWSSLAVAHGPELSAVSEVIASVDEAHRCRERLQVSVRSDDPGLSGPGQGDRGRGATSPVSAGAAAASAAESTAPGAPGLISLGPGAIVRVRVRLEHQHILYGDLDPLLAVRTVELTIGGSAVRDIVSLDREQYLAQPKFAWSEPDEKRRDTQHFVSGPDSLHLEAHVPGHQYYRFPERPVRYSTKMRLRFWYLIAAGTEGECGVRLNQFKDTPIAWRKLEGGGFEQCLKTVGRWTKVERIVQTEAEATILTLEFKIVGETEVGEMWIDDVSLEPVNGMGPGGP
jgi:hypothetical protein